MLFFPLARLLFCLFARTPLLFLSSLKLRTKNHFSFRHIITNRNPFALVKNLMQQTDFIRHKFRLNDGREIRAFLPATPAHKEFCAVTVG